MFESIQKAPADPIMGITESFDNDSNPNKINLSMGVFKDETGNIAPVVLWAALPAMRPRGSRPGASARRHRTGSCGAS